MFGSGECATSSFNATAASWSGTAGRTISQPASFSAAIWFRVARTSRVSVFVIVWTAIGAAPPTTTSPIRTGIVLRRSACTSAIRSAEPRELVVHEPLYIEVRDHGDQRQQRRQARPLHRHLPLTVEWSPA